MFVEFKMCDRMSSQLYLVFGFKVLQCEKNMEERMMQAIYTTWPTQYFTGVRRGKDCSSAESPARCLMSEMMKSANAGTVATG
jgi:hypothetical protein